MNLKFLPYCRPARGCKCLLGRQPAINGARGAIYFHRNATALFIKENTILELDGTSPYLLFQVDHLLEEADIRADDVSTHLHVFIGVVEGHSKGEYHFFLDRLGQLFNTHHVGDGESGRAGNAHGTEEKTAAGRLSGIVDLL